MKRFVLVFFVLCLAIPLSYAEVNVASLSTDELFALQDEINLELADRGQYPVLSAGKYIVGQDIGAGTYTVQEYSNGEDYSHGWSIRIYDSEADYDSDSISEIYSIASTDSAKIILSDEQIVIVEQILSTGYITISEFEGLFMN